MKKICAYILASVVALFAVNSAVANEPPRPGEIEHLKQTGEFNTRLEKARALGNHIIDHDQLNRAITKARARALQQLGPNGTVLSNAPASTQSSTSEAPPSAAKGLPTTGSPKIFALEIDFTDYPAYSGNTQANLQSIIFGDGTVNGVLQNPFPYESLANFYKRASYGKLDLSGGLVLGIYHTGRARSTIPETDQGRESLIEEALTYFQNQGVDFTQFDCANNGTIPYFIVLWTGPDNGWSNFWWGYKANWNDTSFKIGGKSLVTYSWQWEYGYDGSYSGPFDPRVVMHETGHALGLPDYYDYDSNPAPGTGGGVGSLDIMDGVWGDHNAFSKWVLDWISPTIVASGSQQISLNPSGTNPDAVMIWPGATASSLNSEFFIVQNRTRTGNDPASWVYGLSDGYSPAPYPTDAMLIWHVDATLNAAGTDFLYSNSDSAHKLLKLMQADGLNRIENSKATADAAMYYQPGGDLGPLTNPNSLNYLGVDTGVNVTNIAMTGQQMRATFSIDSPRVMPTVTVTKTGIGSGLVTSIDGGVNCGADCAQSYLNGTTVTLTAVAAPGSIFAGWSGGPCSGTGSCTFPITADTAVNAEFDTTLVLNQDFDHPLSSGAPAGWTQATTAGGANWWFNYTSFNTTGGTGGNALGATYGSGPFDSELHTPLMDLTGYGTVGLEFKTSIQTANETADVDVSLDGGTTWKNVWEKVGAFQGPQTVDVDLSSIAAGNSGVMVRFHHYGTGLWWVLDDIKVMASPPVVSSTTALASSQNPSPLGGLVTFTATVNPASASGTIAFFDGTASLGSATLASGQASLGTSSLGLGSHSITAVYSGDETHTGSTSAVLTQTVSQASYTLAYYAGTGGSLTGNASQTVTSGGNGTAVTAVPNNGYHFVNWSDGSTANPRTDLNVTASISVTANFAVTNISISNIPASAVYGGSFTPAFAYTGDGTTSVTTGTPSTCTVTGGLVSFIKAGACTLTAHAAAGTNYAAVDGTAQSFTISSATTTINISNIPTSAVYGGSFTPAFAYTGDGTTSVTTGTPSTCTVTGSLVNFIKAGACTLTAHAAAGTNYAAVDGTAQSFTISSATTTISISNIPTSAVYGGSFTPAFAYTGDGTTSVTTGTPATCTVTGGLVSFIKAGACTLTAHAAAGTNYAAVDGTAQSFTISSATTTINISNIPTSAQVGGSFTPAFAYIGDGTPSVTSSTTACTVAGTTVNFVSAGACTLTAHATAGVNYAAVNGNPQSFTITSTQISTITTVTCPASVTYTGSALAPCTAKVTATDGLNQTLTVTYSNNLNAGTATASASFAGDASHSASSNSTTFTIGKAKATVTLSNLTQAFTGSALSPTVTTSPSGLSYSLAGAPDTNVGSYNVTATITNPNYTGTASGTFVINKAGVSISLTSKPNPANYGDQVTFIVKVAANSGSAVPSGTVTLMLGPSVLTNLTLTNGQATFTTTKLPIGIDPVTATYGGSANFLSSFVPAVDRQFVNPDPTTTAFTVSYTGSGHLYTFTTKVSSTYGSPAGTVTFYDGANVLATVSLASGKANLNVQLGKGTHNLTAIYNGNSTFAPSWSSAIVTVAK